MSTICKNTGNRQELPCINCTCESSSSTAELGGDMPGDDDGDLQARYDMLKGWLVDADSVNDILKKHLGRVLEIAYTWQPNHATKMDRDTLTLAAKSIGYELPPNTKGQRP